MFNVIQLLVSALVIIVTALLVPGAQVGIAGAILAALVLAVINLFIRPILLAFTLPINVLTLGLFTFIINALLILLVANIVPDFEIAGFGTALIFAIVMTIVNIVFGLFT